MGIDFRRIKLREFEVCRNGSGNGMGVNEIEMAYDICNISSLRDAN